MNRGEPRRFRGGSAHVMLILGSLCLLVASLKLAQSLFVPILLAFFIATVSFPITNWLRDHRVPRAVAVLLTVLVDFAFLTGVVLLGVTLVGELQDKWETKYLELTQNRIEETYTGIEERLQEWGWREEAPPKAIPVEGDEVVVAPQPFDWEKVRELVDENIQALGSLEFDKILSFGTDVVGRVVTFFSTAFIVMILTVFMLTEARMFGRRFQAICDARGPNFQRMLSATRDIQRYLGIKTLVSLGTGVLAGLLCWAAGLDFFLLWGIIAFAMNYIPVVGSIIAGVPPTMLALLVSGLPNGVAVAGGYALINLLLGNFVEPMLMGRRFGLSTLVVVLSVLFWGWLWGPIGMLLAVPLTMMLKVVLDNSDEFRWIAVAISKEQRMAEEQRILKSGVTIDPGEESGEAAESA